MLRHKHRLLPHRSEKIFSIIKEIDLNQKVIQVDLNHNLQEILEKKLEIEEVLEEVGSYREWVFRDKDHFQRMISRIALR